MVGETGDKRPIGVFDSGVGGLTVLRQAIQMLPGESFVYIGDTKYVPYGTKSPETVRDLATDVANELLKRDVKALVVACNTISAVALPDIQSLSNNVPVIGVIDPTVMHTIQSAESRNTRHIAVIATETTIQSGVYNRRIQELGNDNFEVHEKVTPAFVPLIEEDPQHHPLIDAMIDMYLCEFKDNPEIKTLILGCTHYPMIKDRIEKYLGRSFEVVDSAQPTARALKNLLKRENILHGPNAPTLICFTSDDPTRAMRIAQDFMGSKHPIELRRIKIDPKKQFPT